MPPWSLYVRCWGQSGKHMLALSFSAFDPQRTFELSYWTIGLITARAVKIAPARSNLFSVGFCFFLGNLFCAVLKALPRAFFKEALTSGV
jgi:uncharacterized membrane protein YgdD (TMEM256/DUF423 family)